MRFSCEHCGKKYVVKDELLPGRTYKSRCKVCGHIIVVKGNEDTTADDMAVLPVPDAPVPTRPPPTAARTPTPPAPPAAKAPAAPPPTLFTPKAPATPPAPPPAAAAPPPAAGPAKPGRDDSGYIDLFDGKGFDEPASSAWPNEPVRRVSATVIPSPSAPRPNAPPEETDPFLKAARAAHVPEPTPQPSTRPAVAPSALVPSPSSVAPSAPVDRKKVAPWVIAAAGAVVVAVLAVVAVLRPWRADQGPGGLQPPTQPVPRSSTASSTPPPAPPPAAEPTPAAAQPPAATPPQPAAAVAKVETPPKAEPPPPAAEPEPTQIERPLPDKKKPEGLSANAVRKALATARKPFNHCVENPSRGLDRPLPAHRISLRLSVEPSGAVSSVAINDPAVARAPVGQCLKSAAMALSFPSFHGAPALVDAPVDIPATPEPKVAKAEPPPKPEPKPEPKAEPPPLKVEPVVAKAEPPPPPPKPEASGANSFVAVEFAGVNRARSGGEIGDTRYSQNSDDAEITDRSFSDGVLTYAGQLGKGHGSSYGGIGFYVNVQPGGHAMDASKYKYLAIKLASPTTSRLRVRLQGPEQSVSSAGCYPTMMVSVSESMKTYRVKLEDFSPESYCGGRGRSAEDTIPNLVGFEIVDTAMQGKPTKFSVGSIVLVP